MSKNDAISIMNNSNLIDTKGAFYHLIFLIVYNKCNFIECNSVEEFYYQNRDVILNRANDYCNNDKERLREQARDKCRNLSEKKKMKNENIEETDIITCPKKITKTKRISKKLL